MIFAVPLYPARPARWRCTARRERRAGPASATRVPAHRRPRCLENPSFLSDARSRRCGPVGGRAAPHRGAEKLRHLVSFPPAKNKRTKHEFLLRFSDRPTKHKFVGSANNQVVELSLVARKGGRGLFADRSVSRHAVPCSR